MANPLESWKDYRLSEAYEVVKTAIVVMEEQTYRIEVLQCYSNRNVPFTTRTSVEKDDAWIDVVDAPWTARDSADSALAQALGFLAERAKKT